MTPDPVAPGMGWVLAVAAAALFAAAYPVVAALVVRRRLGVGWRYVAAGAAVFLVFQVLTRIPAVQLLQATLLPSLLSTEMVRWGWLVGLCLSAGLFEEVGRYVGYRVFMAGEQKSWAKAVAFGIGHGGLESLLLAGALPVLTLVNVRAMAAGLAELPPEQQALAAQQLAALAAQPPWLPLLSAWERLWTLPIHVALSVVVLQVFLRGRLAWLWLAIAAHAAVNLLAVGAAQLLGPGTTTGLLVSEGLVALCGATGLWSIRRLRTPATPVRATPPGARCRTIRRVNVGCSVNGRARASCQRSPASWWAWSWQTVWLVLPPSTQPRSGRPRSTRP